MQGFNHVAGGIAFTGIFASFTDVNIFERPEYIGASVLFSLLPDIDTTNSWLGRAVYPLAKYISVKFGHRTITHSLIFLIGICLIISIFEYNIYHKSTITKIAFFGILSHDIFDMCTKQGIPFFYPFTRRSTVLPANPNMRISSGDFRTEAMIFVGFCILIFTCQPLFANGFWTQYNKAFLTYSHVQREANNRKDLLEIAFNVKNGKSVKGILIEHSEAKFWVYHNNKFESFEDSKEIEWKDFKHTNKILKVQHLQIFGVSKDSLDKLLNHKIKVAQIQANQDITYFEGAILKRSKDVNLEFIHGFNFTQEKQDFTAQLSEIKILEAQKQTQLRDFESEMEKCETLKFQYRFAKAAITKVTDYEKSKMMREAESLKAEFERMEQSIKRPDFAEINQRIEGIKKQIGNGKLVLSANLTILNW